MGELPRSVPKKRRIGLVVLIVLVVVGSLLFIGGMATARFTGQWFEVRSTSMEKTMPTGQVMFVDRTSSIQRGDIVTVRAPEWDGPGGSLYLWRVIGIGGDRVVCCDKERRLLVNGKALDEDYINAGSEASPQAVPFGPSFNITVPPGRLWVMGDNRGAAYDSRYRVKERGGGTLAADQVYGRVFAVGTKGIGSPTSFTRHGLAEARSSPPAPVLWFLVGLLGLLILVVTGVTGLVRLWLGQRQNRRRRPAPRTHSPGGFVPG